ncbi:MAG TPA: hypothetical protein VHT53_11040 [Candidatus Elarobacter sp.]|nr:hypothetical protein [Candidatus Elarobacter sp.]
MRQWCRGTALLETALAIGSVLVVLLGSIQFGVLGFLQTAGDGATFVAAHTYAQSPSMGTAHATAVAAGVFTKIAPSALAVTTQNGIVTATTASSAAGIDVPGAPATATLASTASERLPASTGAPANPFSVTGTLTNYRNASGIANAAHPLGIAEVQSAGNGKNGRYADWYCRASVYAGISFPSTRPTGASAGPGTFWDTSSSKSALATIYAWDTGTTCA